MMPTSSDPVWRSITTAIGAHTNRSFALAHIRPVSGGCINDAAAIDDGNGRCYFVKLNTANRADMFEAEADGLRALSGTKTLRTPAPVCFGSDDRTAWLVLEYLGEVHSRPGAGWGQAGRGLAAMHQCRHQQYGWHRNNTIGSTPQINQFCEDWVVFLRRQRIGHQLDLARRNGYGGRLQARGRRLLDGLPDLFSDYVPEASLLHGDLWSGNIGFVDSDEAVVFDPAVYFGDRETDIAMTELFGGFADDFYRGYEEIWPLDHGYRVRKHVYNLYHLLNHLNLFGTGYLRQCESVIDHVLAQLG